MSDLPFNGTDEEAIEALVRWWDDPVGYVREVFVAEPDVWQAEALVAMASGVDPRVALKACKGPGKSTVLSWFICWFMSTRPHANVLALSITLDNLRDGLWKELAVWYGKSPYLQRVFDFTAERFFAREHPRTWWCSARSFAKDARPDQQANTLAGLHSKHVAIVLDEVSDYPPGVLAAAEGIFSTSGQEARLVVAGNPTSQTGPLYTICTRDRALWRVIEITGDPDDPKRSARIDLAYARTAIAQWGRDNPWVMTNILGLFPPTQSNALLGVDEVSAAMRRDVARAELEGRPKIMGVDVARYGDDRSVVFMRQGPMAWEPTVFRNLDLMTLSGQVARLLEKHKPHACFVDQGGIGAGVVDRLRQLGFKIIGVDFGGKPHSPRFQNRRCEMWWLMAEWVKTASLPPTPELVGELTGVTYDYANAAGKLSLESKDDLKKRGLPSPDLADALALTFAEPVRLFDPMEAAFLSGNSKSHDFQPSIG